jgi:hypothetical protein
VTEFAVHDTGAHPKIDAPNAERCRFVLPPSNRRSLMMLPRAKCSDRYELWRKTSFSRAFADAFRQHSAADSCEPFTPRANNSEHFQFLAEHHFAASG